MAAAVQLSPLARDRLGALRPELQALFLDRLARLAHERRPSEATCVDAAHQIYRWRFGDGTVVYRLYDQVALVYVTRLRWRVPRARPEIRGGARSRRPSVSHPISR